MRLSTLLPLLGLLALGYAERCPRQRTSPGKEILCYTSSNDPEELADVICKCTTLVHQGHELHNLTTAGIEELQKVLKEANPALQFVISVTDPQHSLRTSATTRQEASGRLANILSQVDGVELDVTAGSKERLTHFVKGLKDEMTRKSNEKRILLALPTQPEELAKQYDIKALAKYVDLFTLSTNYLFDETESSHTFHPSRLMGIFDMLNADSLVDLISGLGVPKKKLLISLPASAYKFTLKTKDKTIPGSPTEEEKPTVISQKELCDLMSAGEWTVERDTDLTAPYAFKDSTWIAFEDKTSVGIKGKYVLLRELAGLGIHDVENDQKNNCGKPITYEVYNSFTDMKRKTRGAVLASLENDINHVDIPTSRHVKSSGYRIVRVVDTAGAIHAIRENTQTEFICTRQGYFVHPKSCNRFYRCVKFDQGVDDFSVFEFDCPAGLAFDERTEVCVWPGSLTEGSPCPGSSEIAPVPRARFQCPERDGYYADPQNCRWFFACFDLGEPEPMAYEFRCPFGLVFDEQKLICEWPWLVPGCGASGYSRTEYGGGEYGIRQQGNGAGYGQGSGNGGAGYGDYSGTGISIGGAGQYRSGPDSSLYKGSKPSESRYTETGPGQYDGANRGLKYPGDGRYREQGYSGQGADGSGYSGADGAGGERGIGSAGNAGGIGGVGGAGGRGGVGGTGGAGGRGGTGGAGDDGGAGGSEDTGSKYFGAGGAGYGYSGAGNAGGAGSGYSGAGGAGSQYSGAGANSGYSGTGGEGLGYSGAEGAGSGYSGEDGTGSKYSGAGNAGSKYSGSGGNTYSGSGGDRSKYTGANSGSTTFGTDVSGQGGDTGSTYTGYSGSGLTSSSNSGTTSGFGYSGAHNSASGHSGAGEIGTKYSGSTGSGSVHGVYPGEGVSIVDYEASRKPGVVIETVPIGQGPASSIYQTGTTGSGYVSTVGHTGSVAGNSGYNGLSSSTKYGGSGKDGLTVSVQTGGSGYSSSSGVAGDYSVDHSGTSDSDGQDVVNGGRNPGSVVLTGTSESGDSEYTRKQNAGYISSGQGDFDAQDVVNGGYNSGSIIVNGATGNGAGGYNGQGINSGSVAVTGTTGSGYTGGYTGRPITGNAFTGVSSSGSGYSTPLTTLNPAYSVFGARKPVTPAQEIFLQTVTPGYSVTSSGIKSSVAYGSSSGSKGAGGVVTGGSGYVDNGSSSTVSEVGKGGISTGTTTYHGKGGSSSSYLSTKTSNANGNGIQGGFVTSNVHTGTVLSHDGSSGTVISGNEDEGSVYVGSSTPGYVETNSVTPGYVINGVTKTVYGQSTPGTFITGTSAPGVVHQGSSGPSSYVDGQIYKGAGVRGSTVNVAGVRGSTTYYGNTGASAGSKGGAFSVNGGVSSIQDSGYKTNEYHDNGGRGTVTYNNGYTTTKFTEKELQDRFPTYASLPDTIVSGGRIEGSNGVVLGNTLAGFDGYTSQQFTKTGPTKTGFTTAQIGGTGSYVTNTGYRRPTPSPAQQNVGSQAFATGQGSNKGYATGGGSIGNDVNGLAYVTSTVAPDVSHIDTSKINLGPASKGGSSGYRYTKPAVQFVTGSVTSSTPTPFSVTYQESVAPLTVTTPASPHLNVEVYNTPSVVTSAPITAAPAVVNTYSYRRPSSGYKQPSYQTAGSPTGSPAFGGYKYRRPTQSPIYQGSSEGDQQLFTVSSTPAPIAFATRPADIYKSTLFEAAKLPSAVSSLAPVFDNGYKTIVSSTAAPVAVTTGQYFYKDSRFETSSAVSGLTSGEFDIDNQQPGTVFQKIPFSSTPSPNTEDGYTYQKPTKQLTYNSPSTVTPSVTIYQQPKYTIGEQQVKYSTAGTPAPDFDGSYQKPFIPARPAAKRPTYQKEFGSVSTSFSSAGAQGYQYSKPTVKFVSSTASPDYTGSRGGSPTNLDIPQDEVKKLIGNYERGSVKYTSNSYGDESIGSVVNSGAFGYKDIGKRPSVTPTVFVSSTASPAYQPTTPDSKIRANAFGKYISSSLSSSSGYRGAGYYSSPTPSYEISTLQTPAKEGKGKVIVKLSDLHPLLLGKLGAQCTCRSDPFETLRGPGAKSVLIKSNKGKIDLSNYDESDVYVDLEADREPGQSVGYYRSPTPGPSASSLRTPAIAIFGVTTPAPPQVFRSRGKPSTAYLPTASTPSTIGGSSGPVIVVPDDGGLGSPSDIADTQFVNAPEGFAKEGAPVGRTAGARRKSEKSFSSAGATGNAIGGAGAAFDRYGPGGWRNDDETLQGGSDCARAGLFRHPKYCNKFYACHYDEWKQKFTLHVFNCPVHLSFDSSAGACNWPTKGPACQDDNLLV
ncbi:mucin-19-like isoform X2 [Diprion similis]|uniref:mucin-19-like isoform X2 n=1 Tax=Diprion similis TaxID=362088 RepID=UPI001EF87C6F|nr:mucin-19-like isoform X2 [Diprion similis]